MNTCDNDAAKQLCRTIYLRSWPRKAFDVSNRVLDTRRHTLKQIPVMATASILMVLILYSGLSFSFGSDVSVNDNVMCGPNCLWLAAKSYNITTSLKKLRYFAQTDLLQGTSLKGMLKALRQIGLEPVLIKTDWKGLSKIRQPAILLLNQSSNGHYTFLEKIGPKLIRLVDPPERKTWTRDEFMSKFTSYTIVVCKDTEDKKHVEDQFKTQATSYCANRAAIFLAVVFASILILFVLTKRNRGTAVT